MAVGHIVDIDHLGHPATSSYRLHTMLNRKQAHRTSAGNLGGLRRARRRTSLKMRPRHGRYALQRRSQSMQVAGQAESRCNCRDRSQIIDTIKNVIHEGNVRRITIKQEGRTIAEFPLTFGVVGAALAPALAAVGAIAALVTDCTIEVERV